MKTSFGNKIAAHGEIAEIKRIYSAIEASLSQKNPACLIVTSGTPGEGKTTIATGIAAYAARQNGERVLVMDLNWYSPALHKSFGLDLSFGYETLKEADAISDVAQPSGLDNLDVIPAVQSSPGEDIPYAQADTLAAGMIRKARESYGFVVVDTSAMYPPNRRMIDPAILSREADGVAIVTLANATPREKVKRAMKTLENAGANIIGVIANQWQNPMA